MAIMGSLFLGDLSGCVARLKEASGRSEEACTLGGMGPVPVLDFELCDAWSSDTTSVPP